MAVHVPRVRNNSLGHVTINTIIIMIIIMVLVLLLSSVHWFLKEQQSEVTALVNTVFCWGHLLRESCRMDGASFFKTLGCESSKVGCVIFKMLEKICPSFIPYSSMFNKQYASNLIVLLLAQPVRRRAGWTRRLSSWCCGLPCKWSYQTSNKGRGG